MTTPPPSDPFIHLRVHTEYSLVDSTVRIDALVEAAAAQGMPSIAVTDLSNMFALVKFYKAAMSAGIKPIAGCELWVAGEEESEEPTLVVLLVQDDEGCRNLFELISEGYLHHQRMGRPQLPRALLFEKSGGLIALSGAAEGEIGRALLHGHADDAARRAREWMSAFPDRFYIEVQRSGRPGEEPCVQQAVTLAARLECPVVATNDVRFLEREEFEVHEVRVCIQQGRTLDDPRRERLYSEEQYLKSAAEMAELFADLPEALANSVEIARRCNVTIDLGNYYMPEYEVPGELATEEYFAKAAREGLERKIEALFDRAAPDYAERRRPYDERLEDEITMIVQMGFAGYFLIVMEFIQWSKDHGVSVGPGRGSGAGSIVAWALGITGIDPLRYDLLFERFLNPDRVSLPDFDIDFCMEGRDSVIHHVVERYGRDAVSQIITFGSMAARAVVRDVTRVQGKPWGLGDKIAKLIPADPGMTLEKALDEEQLLRQAVEEDEEVQEIIEMAMRLEGLTRNVGKHAGGVVIAPTRLTDFTPIYCDEGGAGLMTQFDKKDVEQSGLVKFDFLGLKTLTVLDWAVASVNRWRALENLDPIDLEKIPLDDPKVFSMLRQAKTTAVFQLESRGMKDLIKRLIPERFDDIVALVALFRPGPMQMADDFINRKSGKEEIDYLHPDLEPVLRNTYGVMLYQEQVMQIARILAGFTMAQADILRAAMSKKDHDEMGRQRVRFLKGAKERGVAEAQADYIFDLMEKFAGYGFNKAHSVSYAMVAYQTAWLKVHYPAAFMAAVLSVDMQNTDKIVTNIEESRQMGLTIVPPDVNRGSYRFVADGTERIIYGLGAIKGLGEGPIENIVKCREEAGPFTSLFDFCDRIDLRKVSKLAIEALLGSGALDFVVEAPADLEGADAISWKRSWLAANREGTIRFAEQKRSQRESGHQDLFGGVDADSYEEVANVRPWSDRDRLQAEKETLGLYLTGHPFEMYASEVAQIPHTRIADLRVTNDPQTVVGLVVAHRTMKSRRGDTIAFVTLDDRSGRMEAAVNGELFDATHDKLQKDSVLLVRGGTTNDEFSGGIRMRATEVWDLEEARARGVKRMLLCLDGRELDGDFSTRLAEILKPFSGGDGCPVVVAYRGSDAQAEVRLGDSWRVKPHDDLIQRLRDQFGREVVRLDY